MSFPFPKITHPISIIIIPSTKTNLKVRPMLSKEEKILLLAKESADGGDIFRAIKQVVNNCILDEKFNIDDVTIFDLEFIFLKLRALSISNEVHLSMTEYQGTPEEETVHFSVNLDKVVVINLPDRGSDPRAASPNMKIQVNSEMDLMMKYPQAALYSDTEFLNMSEKTYLDVLIENSIKSVNPAGSSPILFGKGTPEERKIFIDDLPIKVREEIIKFLNNLPTLYYKIEYETKKGDKKTIELKTLNDFFTLR